MNAKSTEIIRHNANVRMSPVVEVPCSRMVVISGQVADEKEATIEEQTSKVLQKVDDLLATAGTERKRIFAANIWLAGMTHFDGMNSVWDDWIPEGCAPARVCVEAQLPQPDALVEIQVWATK